MSDYVCFTGPAARTFRSAAAVILPDAEGAPPLEAADIVAIADRALARRPVGDQKRFILFLAMLEWLPLLRFGRSFSELPLDKRARMLESLGESRLSSKFRQGYFGLKTFVLMGHYGRAATFDEIGYPGPRKDAPFYVQGGNSA
jgi:hypothetical protein